MRSELNDPGSGSGSSSGGVAEGGGRVSAKDAHSMIVAVAVMVAFVIVATIVAGIDPQVGKGILAAMFLLLLLQGLNHSNVIGSWVAVHPLAPTS